MTTYLSQAFDAFAEGLRPTAEERAAIDAARARAATVVAEAWGAADALLLGPLSRGTSLRPVHTVPLAVLLPESWYERHVAPATENPLPRILAELTALLPEGVGEAPVSCEEDALYVRLGGLEVAFIPSFSKGDGAILLPDALVGGWRVCDVHAQQRVVDERDEALAGQARPLARLMHAWVAHHRLKIHPLHLEIMSLAGLHRPPVHLAEGVFTILQKMPRAVHDPCPDPGNPGHMLDLYLRDATQRARIADAAFIDARTMAQAIDADHHGEGWAAALVREVFGTGFPTRRPRRPVAH